MINLVVERKWKKADYCIGRFYVNGTFLCNSLEDTDRGLDKSMPLKSIQLKKVKDKTAIPTGTYIVRLSYSPKFSTKVWGKKYNGLVPEIVDVPGFSGVRIHPGTDASSTSGCPIIGDNKIPGKVINSQKRYYELMDDYLMPAHKKSDTITITIK